MGKSHSSHCVSVLYCCKDIMTKTTLRKHLIETYSKFFWGSHHLHLGSMQTWCLRSSWEFYIQISWQQWDRHWAWFEHLKPQIPPPVTHILQGTPAPTRPHLNPCQVSPFLMTTHSNNWTYYYSLSFSLSHYLSRVSLCSFGTVPVVLELTL